MPSVTMAGRTHAGHKRERNEDCFAIAPEHGLAVVADGLGGAAAGEVASFLAVEAVVGLVSADRAGRPASWPVETDPALIPAENLLRAAVLTANERIHRAATADGRYTGMGSTIVALLIEGSYATLAHVGDSRAYRLRGEAVERLTDDHSLLSAVSASFGAELTTRHVPLRNKLMRSLGKPKVKVELRTVDVRPGDTLLLCSDGVWSEIDDVALGRLARRWPRDPERLSDAVIQAGLNGGGQDNATVVVVRVD